MALIHKEPYLTPEMISAWNSGGTVIDTIDLLKSAFTSADGNYNASANLTSSVVNAIKSAASVDIYLLRVTSGNTAVQEVATNFRYSLLSGYNKENTMVQLNNRIREVTDAYLARAYININASGSIFWVQISESLYSSLTKMVGVIVAR